jgi:opacity protein-like surface antigen
MRRITAGILLLIAAAPAAAQPGRFELGVSAGYTLSEGVEVDSGIIDEVDPESGFSYGVNFGGFLNRFLEIGFLMSQEQSKLLLEGGILNDLEDIDLKVNNYHGYVSYHFGYSNAPLRPFMLFGMGATHYLTGDSPLGNEIDDETQFSTTWGGGVKYYPPSMNYLGLRFMGRWTPTYITTDAEGAWCDPYWGCTTYGDVEYSHQFEWSGGAVFRF